MELADTDLENIIEKDIKSMVISIDNFEVYEMIF